jgi:hypothetical protein
MSWQKCPICEGSGFVIGVGDTEEECPTCEGKRIISDIDAKPPVTRPAIEPDDTTELKAEEIVAPISVLDDLSEEEIMYYHSPYYDELQARKEQRQKEIESEESHGNN